jgi:hypothetical protein
MKIKFFVSLVMMVIQTGLITSCSQGEPGKMKIAIEWQNIKPSGAIEVFNGKLAPAETRNG